MSSDSAARALSSPTSDAALASADDAGAPENIATIEKMEAQVAAIEDAGTQNVALQGEAANKSDATSPSETTLAAARDEPVDDFPPAVLTPEVVGFLLRAVPQNAMWKWLGEDERAWLQQRMTRGFQNTIRALKQPIVRTRLVDHLQRESDDYKAVLILWAQSELPPAVIDAARALPDDLDWADETVARRAFPTLRRFDAREILLALAASERRAILDAWLSIVASAPDGAWSDGENPDFAAHEYSCGADKDSEASQNLLDSVSEPTLEAREEKQISATRELARQELEIKRAREEAARWRHQAAQARSEAAASRLALETRESQARREAQEWQLKLAQETRRGAQAEAGQAEAQKTLDRTARRLKQSEKAGEDLAAETKRLKRQVRQSQQLHEELKKQLASATSKLLESQAREVELQEIARVAAQQRPASRSAAPRKTYSAPSISTAPLVAGASGNVSYAETMRRGADANTPALLDQPFLWRGEDRVFRVSAREVRRAIDRNDETFVFALIQGLDALREADARLHRVFLDRARQAGRYYGRVLTADTTRVLVDASNVARFERNARGKGELSHLLAMRDELRRRDCFPIVMVADASLRHHIDEPEELLAMARRGELEIAPVGTEADEYLAREARRSGAYVISNDRTFHLKVAPDWEPPRINFRIHDGYIMLDEF